MIRWITYWWNKCGNQTSDIICNYSPLFAVKYAIFTVRNSSCGYVWLCFHRRLSVHGGGGGGGVVGCTPLARQTPRADTTPGQTPPPPPRWLLQRTVRILLECILVSNICLVNFPCLCKFWYFYRPPTKLREGNVFSCVFCSTQELKFTERIMYPWCIGPH